MVGTVPEAAAVLTRLWQTQQTAAPVPPREVKEVRQVLKALQPVLAYVRDPARHPVVGVVPYAVAAVTILGLAGLLLGQRWERGPLHRFVATQYDALVHWTRDRYFRLSSQRVQRELNRRLRKEELRKAKTHNATQYEEKSFLQRWGIFFKNKLSDLAPHNMIRSLLDPTNPYSWGLLGGMWVQYMTGTHLPYIGSQLPFGAVASATAAKIALYVGHLIHRLIRREIYGDDYDPLFIRLPTALLASLLELLHVKLTHQTLVGSDTEETGDPSLNDWRRKLKELQELVTHDIRQFSHDVVHASPKQFMRAHSAQRAQQENVDQRRREDLLRVNNWLRAPLHFLAPLPETEFCGRVVLPATFWSGVNVISTDAIYLSVWIRLAEHLLAFVQEEERTTITLAPLGEAVDATRHKALPRVYGTNAWTKFQAQREATVTELWEPERNRLNQLRQYLTTYVLRPIQRVLHQMQTLGDQSALVMGIPREVLVYVKATGPVVSSSSTRHNSPPPAAARSSSTHRAALAAPPTMPAALDSVPLTLFLTEDEHRKLESVQRVLDRHEEEAPLREIHQQLDLLQRTLEERRQTYVAQVQSLYRRHQVTVPLCRTACAILRYYQAVQDAFDVSLRLYETNQHLVGFDDSVSAANPDEGFSTIYSLDDALAEGRPVPEPLSVNSMSYVNYASALQNVYGTLKHQLQPSLQAWLKALMGYMCTVHHLGLELDPPIGSGKPALHDDDLVAVQSALKRLAVLYHLGEDAQCPPWPLPPKFPWPLPPTFPCPKVESDPSALSLPAEWPTERNLAERMP